MAYTMLDPPAGSWGFEEDSFEARALAFLRESCEGLRFDREKSAREDPARGVVLGESLKQNQIPYNMQMDVERLCLERSLAQFLRSGRKEDAFDVYFCYLEMFIGDYEKSRRMIELLSEYEANGSGLLMKHRDHYSHSVYVFALGLAVFSADAEFRKAYHAHMTGVSGAVLSGPEEHDTACHFLRFWGMTALFHDIGYPFELPFEQAESYFELQGGERGRLPFLAYRAMEPLRSLEVGSPPLAERASALYDRPDARFSTTDELFAFELAEKLAGTYPITREGMLAVLRDKPERPEKFSFFMDHAYFSATILFRKLFLDAGLPLCRAHIDALTAILMHNSLYKFSIARYKSEGNIPFRANLHPLAWMLMLCDELQSWDRTAYGRDSRKELHPFGCRITLRGGEVRATYLYDEAQRGKIEDFKRRYARWEAEGKPGKAPKLKAWSGMYTPHGGVSDFQADIERIVAPCGLRLRTEMELAPDRRRRGRLSDSSFINLYYFTLLVKARDKTPTSWRDDPEAAFREMPRFLAEVERGFHETSLEYRLDCIDRTKAFAAFLERIGCFYSDKAVDFPELEAFSDEEIELLGALEHRRWLQFHYDLGWRYGTGWNGDKALRERMRRHNDLIEGYDSAAHPCVSEAEGMAHYRLALDETERLKDKEPLRYMLSMMRHMDGVRFYRIRSTEEEETALAK